MIRYGLTSLLLGLAWSVHAVTLGQTVQPGDILGYEEQYLPMIVPFERREAKEMLFEARGSEDVELLYRLGHMYHFGENVRADMLQAEELYRKAAKLGHVPSMLALGQMYKLGDGASGMAQSTLKARKWFKKASTAESPYGDYEIGLMYETGNGVLKSHKRAFAYMQKAVKGEVLAAYIKLGIYYRYGIGVEKDLKESVRYFKMFQASTNDKRAQLQVDVYLGDFYYYLAYYTPRDAEEERFEWLRLAAHYGNLQGQLELATAYRDGRGVAQDYGQALAWYAQASEVEHPYAFDNLAYLHSQGLGVRRDDGKAFRYYKKGAELGSANSAWGLGYLYYHGRGTKQDYKKSQLWFNRAKSLAVKQGLVVQNVDEE